MNSKKDKILEKYKEQIYDAINDLKTKGKRHRQIPNILTALRLLSPCLILPAAATGNIPLTIGLAVGFGLTDVADGFIAKNWHLTSELGKDLDAITDKVFVGTLLLASSILNPILLVNLALEGAIAGINIKQKLSGNETESTKIGKFKTWFVFGLGGLGLVAPFLGVPALLPILSGVTAAMQSFAIASYVSKYNKTKQPQQKPKQQVTQTSIIEEEKKIESEEVKTNNYEHTNQNISPEISLDDKMNALKEMSDFFHQEQENLSQGSNQNFQQTTTEKPKTFQKTQ